jgi:hypothetical protein
MYIDNGWGRGDCGKRNGWEERKMRKNIVFCMMRGGRGIGRKERRI